MKVGVVMQKLYRFRSSQLTGLWVESKTLAQKWLQEHLDYFFDYDFCEIGEECYIESLDLYDINETLEPDEFAKADEVWELVENENAEENPREMGYDFDVFVTWKKVEQNEKANV